eukprot:366000-Chlamydomonas_euryale.AAC.17
MALDMRALEEAQSFGMRVWGLRDCPYHHAMLWWGVPRDVSEGCVHERRCCSGGLKLRRAVNGSIAYPRKPARQPDDGWTCAWYLGQAGGAATRRGRSGRGAVFGRTRDGAVSLQDGLSGSAILPPRVWEGRSSSAPSLPTARFTVVTHLVCVPCPACAFPHGAQLNPPSKRSAVNAGPDGATPKQTPAMLFTVLAAG